MLSSTFYTLESHTNKKLQHAAQKQLFCIKIKGIKLMHIIEHFPLSVNLKKKRSKVKQSRYTPWRRLGGEEV
jgi:hypothetical protein